MDGVKGEENEKGMGERGGSRERNRKAQRGESQGESDWAKLVHSLGLPEGSGKEGLLTKDPRLATTEEGEPDAEGEV